MRRAPYWVWFSVQSVGAALILWHGIPLYRSLLAQPAHGRVPADVLILACVAVLCIQLAYWIGLSSYPRPAPPGHVLMGHLSLFFGRLSFVFTSALFSAVFLVNFPELRPAPHGLAVLFGVLFSMFCYSRELERLGQALAKPPSDAGEE